MITHLSFVNAAKEGHYEQGEQPRTLRSLIEFLVWRVGTSVEKHKASLGLSDAGVALLR
jgi:hypothetical protein